MAYYDRAKNVWRAALQVNGKRKAVVLRGSDGKPARDARAAERAEALLRAAMQQQSAAEAASSDPRRKGDDAFGRVAQSYLEAVADARQRANKAAHVARLVTEIGAATPVGEVGRSRAKVVVAKLERQPVLVYFGGPKGNPKDASQWKPRIDRRTGEPASLSKSTLRAIKVTLGAIMGHAEGLGLIQNRPTMPTVRPPKRLPNPLRREEVATLARVAPPARRRRDRARGGPRVAARRSPGVEEVLAGPRRRYRAAARGRTEGARGAALADPGPRAAVTATTGARCAAGRPAAPRRVPRPENGVAPPGQEHQERRRPGDARSRHRGQAVPRLPR